MSGIAARRTLGPRELTRVGDRISFLYVERCTVHREDNALTVTDADGTDLVPSAALGTLMLGPGTRITHQAMALLGECGAGVLWVGEQSVRYYAGGRALTRSSRLVEAQATAWANQRSRLAVARAMYGLRFPGADTAGATRRTLLGMEGTRLRECYRAESARTGVRWHRREYHPGDFAAGDPPNRAITAAAQCMYGIAHSVVAALGCSPGLGFVHSGNERSFVLDIADLYKVDVAIPAAFDAAADGPDDIASRTRRALRDRINATGLLDRCVRDITSLLEPYAPAAAPRDNGEDADTVRLHTDGGGTVAAGRNHAVSPDDDSAYGDDLPQAERLRADDLPEPPPPLAPPHADRDHHTADDPDEGTTR